MIGIFVGVTVGVACVAWVCNKLTAHEKRSQARLYHQRERYYEDYRRARELERQRAKEEQKRQAEKYRQLLLNTIHEYEGKIEPIRKGLEEMDSVMRSEITADSTSPYRKSALRREFVRIEDAKMRLDEYIKYLNYEKRQIEKLWKIERFDLLLKREATDALLPTEWLYKGKLVIVKLNEIDNEQLSKFNHTLSFSESEKEIQQTLAIKYGDEFPVLITRYKQNENEKHKRIFYCCVARGIAYLEHIIPARPAEVTIERYLPRERAYLGSLFDGLVTVNLPELKRQHSHLRCINGEKVSVYFENYNLTLTENPSGKKNDKGYRSPISVTTIEPAQIGNLGGYVIFMAVDEMLLASIADDRFYSSESQWTLLEFDMETTELSLGKATVEIKCRLTETGDGLKVVNVSQTKTSQVGVDIPFELLLISQDLEPESIFAWQYGVEQLLQFATQTAFNKQGAEERVKQAKFFRRWQAVLDYQKRYESQRAVEFEGTVIPVDRNSYKLIVPYSVSSLTDDDKEWNSNVFKNIRNRKLIPEYCCQLQRWDYEKQSYVPALESRKNTAHYSLTETGDFEIEGRFYIPSNSESSTHLFKFTITLPNAPLQRQQQALEAFFEDRLIEPKLKDIFLNPNSYQAEQNNDLQNHDIQWQTKLTPNQQQVVETSLKTKHISLIQGPPGTGKTTVIVEMLSQLLTQNPSQRILVVSQQNTAVDNALSRFKEKNIKLVENSVNIVRIGNPYKIEESLVEHHFDSLYDDFLLEAIEDVNLNFHKLPDELQHLSYQWKAVLLQMQDSHDSKVSDEFFSVMLANKNLIGATCVGLAARKKGVDYLEFDIAIVDEAGRATVPELLIPLLRCRKVILIGDHFQLPPSIDPILREDDAKEVLPFIAEAFLEKSFFESLFEELPGSCKAILQEQFRMPPPIGNLVADLFYTVKGERQLFNGKGDAINTEQFVLPESLYWVDIVGKQYKAKNSTSLENVAEAQSICNFLKKLAECNKRDIDVAVITPYGAQKHKILELLKVYSESNEQTITIGTLKIKIDTVDGFQGSEAEVVCYSTVRTDGSLKFLLDRKRLNVACSRAKENLIFFGHRKYLEDWQPRKEKDEVNLFCGIIERSCVTNLDALLEEL